MTAITGFILAAALLVLVILAILLPPLLRKPKPSSAFNQREANIGIFRDQLSELERDRSEDLLGARDFEQAKIELQRRLLEETQTETTSSVKSAGRKTALALLITLPLAAAGGYTLLGTPQALDPVHTQAHMKTQQIDEMLVKLTERLKANPEDTKGWVMLARSNKALGRYAASAEAYSHGGALVDKDPSLLADYAEVLLQVNGGNFKGKPTELITRALKLDPNEPQALFLAGAASVDNRDFSKVVDYWGRLLLQLEPGSEEARSLGAAVDKAREMLLQAENQMARKSPKNATSAVSLSPETISGEITISGKLAAQTQPDDLLFIFARANEGSRMPIAVIRSQAAEVPLKFHLDDSMALPGGQKLSGFKTVTIEARIARAGKAQSSSGDLFGSIKGVKPGSRNLKLVIDQVQP